MFLHLAVWLALSTPCWAETVNINTADAEVLATLPGLGPAKAAAIVGYRRTHGPFTSVDKLDNVPGIGPSTIEGIRALVTVGSDAAPPIPESQIEILRCGELLIMPKEAQQHAYGLTVRGALDLYQQVDNRNTFYNALGLSQAFYELCADRPGDLALSVMVDAVAHHDLYAGGASPPDPDLDAAALLFVAGVVSQAVAELGSNMTSGGGWTPPPWDGTYTVENTYDGINPFEAEVKYVVRCGNMPFGTFTLTGDSHRFWYNTISGSSLSETALAVCAHLDGIWSDR